MKKIVVGLAVLGLMVACASAGVGILWKTQYGVYDHNAPNVTGNSNALLDSYSMTWQLIYCGADDAADLPSTSLGGVGIADDYVTDDDVVWASRSLPQSVAQGNVTASDGTVWTYWTANVSGNVVYEDLGFSLGGGDTGYVYQRIFEGTPALLSYYYQTTPVALDLSYAGSPGFPQQIYLDTLTAGVKPNQQIQPAAVPEPATMSLLGLGALVMAIRRRRS